MSAVMWGPLVYRVRAARCTLRVCEADTLTAAARGDWHRASEERAGAERWAVEAVIALLEWAGEP